MKIKTQHLSLVVFTASFLQGFALIAAEAGGSNLPACAAVKQSASMCCLRSTSKLTPQDVAFAREANMGSMLEVKLGQLTTTHTQAATIKSFGGEMISDHGAAAKRLQALAKSQGLQLPTQLDAPALIAVKKFARLYGKKFDQHYVTAMIVGHRDALALFQKAARECKNTDLRMFAKQTIGMIQHHLQMIEKIQAAMK